MAAGTAELCHHKFGVRHRPSRRPARRTWKENPMAPRHIRRVGMLLIAATILSVVVPEEVSARRLPPIPSVIGYFMGWPTPRPVPITPRLNGRSGYDSTGNIYDDRHLECGLSTSVTLTLSPLETQGQDDWLMKAQDILGAYDQKQQPSLPTSCGDVVKEINAVLSHADRNGRPLSVFSVQMDSLLSRADQENIPRRDRKTGRGRSLTDDTP